MKNTQPGILADVPRNARYLFFSLKPGASPMQPLTALAATAAADNWVVGIGQTLVTAMGQRIDGLKTFPALSGPGIAVPSTPMALWIWLRGDDPGDLVHQTLRLETQLSPAFALEHVINAFQHRDSRDLTGYEDGTENPTGDDAIRAGIVRETRPEMDGSSFVAVQQWVHDLSRFKAMGQQEQDHAIGRRLSDNEEIDEAPESAHVKRTAQESFDPEAHILRRSMPWADEDHAGLVFVAFGRSFEAYEALLNRMLGNEDGVTDALFGFTRPRSGGYFWCPPVNGGRLDLSALAL